MDAAAFVKQAGKLPSLPTLYYELTQAVDDPKSSISTIGGVVRKDQSLASRLLKLANSAYYSFPSQVETIEEALQLIGLREMRDLALATCVIGTFKNLPEHLVSVADFWKHSIACGVTSSLLAERRHDPSPERFFVGGLLHDIGRLIMYLTAPRESERILAKYIDDKAPCCRVESEVLGFDHADLGAELLSMWKIPVALVEMVRRHHNPDLFHSAVIDGATVHCADFIVTAMEFGSSGEPYVTALSAEACQRAMLQEADVTMLVDEVEQRCDQLCSILISNSSS
jgi:putative nucleotidyltransferase with HDIG domain